MARHREKQHRNQWALAIRQFTRNKLAVLGFILLTLFVLLAFLASLIAPFDPTKTNLRTKLKSPGLIHYLGTDYFGRDVLSRLLFGARTSLSVGLIVVGISLTLGVPIGLIAGYYGGRIDNVLMRIMDGLLTFPPLLLAIAIIGSLGQEIQNVMLALGLVYTPIFARLVRGSTLTVREEVYVLAAQAIGASNRQTLIRHIFPNILAPIMVQATVTFSRAILAEASLSFLGLGTQPPHPSWGRDLSEARRYLGDAPWLVVFPTLTIMLNVLSINFIGDGLRDALDPRFRSKR